MKLAFMSFSCPQLDLDEMLELAVELDCDGIEPRLDAGHAHGVETSAGPEERETIRRKARDSGITICCLATSLRYADPQTADSAIKESFPRIDLAADVGSPRLRIFGGSIPKHISREKAIANVASAMKESAACAEERGVTLCFETHDDWCEPEHVAAVLEKVNSPALMANWDIMHPVRKAGRTIEESFDILKPWINHLHVHDGVNKSGELVLVPIGEGMVDHAAALKKLSEIGYDGFISGEWINWEPYQEHLPRELATLKRFLTDISS